MIIQSIIEREGGTKVNLNGSDYHFLPDASTGFHLATVEKKEDIERFLSIEEGFVEFNNSNNDVVKNVDSVVDVTTKEPDSQVVVIDDALVQDVSVTETVSTQKAGRPKKVINVE